MSEHRNVGGHTSHDGGLHSAPLPPNVEVPGQAQALSTDQARRQLLELSITAAGVGTFDWDLVDGTLVWDDRLIELFGYETATFDQSIEAFNARLHPEDLVRVNDDLQRAIDSCGEFASDYRIVLPGDQLRWIAARGRALSDEGGVAVRLLGAAWDITRHAEDEARMSRSLETMSTPFFSLDISWRFTFVNTEAERVLSRHRSELNGAVMWDLFPAAVGSVFETNYRHAMSTGEPVAFDAYYPAPLDAWFEVRAWRNPDGLSVYFLDVTGRHKAQEEAEQAAQRADLLAKITEELSGTLDSGKAAERLLSLVIPTIADWGIVNLVDDKGQAGTRNGLRFASALHADRKMQDSLEQYAAGRLDSLRDDAVIVQAVEANRPRFILHDALEATLPMIDPGPLQDLLRSLAPESVLVFPLDGRNGPVGMLTLANTAESGPFSEEDIVTVKHISARAGLVLDNARFYRQKSELAEGLQRSLLTAPVQPDHMQVVVRYRPAAEAAQVGGDWYDAFMQPGGATVLVIGDVIGHDAEATSLMGQIRSTMRTVGALDNDSSADILRKTDRVMHTLRLETTATALVARLEQDAGEADNEVTRLRWSNAGHPPPLVLNPDGSVCTLDGTTHDLLLGVSADALREEAVVTLDRNATVLLYTDGLVERRGKSLDEGLQQLRESLAKFGDLDPETMCDEVLDYMLPHDSADDVALIAVKLHPQG